MRLVIQKRLFLPRMISNSLKIMILLHYLSLQKALKNVSNTDIDLPTSTINSNINIPYRFRKSTSMEHYYDEPTHVQSNQKKRYRRDSVRFLRMFSCP